MLISDNKFSKKIKEIAYKYSIIDEVSDILNIYNIMNEARKKEYNDVDSFKACLKAACIDWNFFVHNKTLKMDDADSSELIRNSILLILHGLICEKDVILSIMNHVGPISFKGKDATYYILKGLFNEYDNTKEFDSIAVHSITELTTLLGLLEGTFLPYPSIFWKGLSVLLISNGNTQSIHDIYGAFNNYKIAYEGHSLDKFFNTHNELDSFNPNTVMSFNKSVQDYLNRIPIDNISNNDISLNNTNEICSMIMNQSYVGTLTNQRIQQHNPHMNIEDVIIELMTLTEDHVKNIIGISQSINFNISGSLFDMICDLLKDDLIQIACVNREKYIIDYNSNIYLLFTQENKFDENNKLYGISIFPHIENGEQRYQLIRFDNDGKFKYFFDSKGWCEYGEDDE